jgi:5-methyltetrahydropteroyltriglutamate--homocysteine methyltransferase
MAISSNLGYPRIGRNREIKKVLEDYWAGKTDDQQLSATAQKIRRENWILQKQIGIDQIPSNDFSLYDHMLDMAILLGAIPDRFHSQHPSKILETYFAMARGAASGIFQGLPPLEMTKWFNTNYHYLVPEISPATTFRKNSSKIISEYKEAFELGIPTRPVIIGPVSFLLLSKAVQDNFHPISKISELLSVYSSILEELAENNVDWVQLDEPCLVNDLDSSIKEIYQAAFANMTSLSKRPKILLAAYFDSLEENLPLLMESAFDAVHLDLSVSTKDLDSVLEQIQKNQILSLGIVSGRNIWKTDFRKAIFLIVEKAMKKLSPENIMISSSCSLLHIPQDLELESHLAPDVLGLMAFAKQKLKEIADLTKLVNEILGKTFENIKNEFTKKDVRVNSFKKNESVRNRVRQISPKMGKRHSEFRIRKEKQAKRFAFPLLPITTIGSFPQTTTIRNKRRQLNKNEINHLEYDNFIKEEITKVIRFQEEIGIDVLVHGEFERNDMVQYFAEQMDGFAFTEHGWVQSFGSRYVRPPIIFGDVSRPKPMTLDWIAYAQSKTDKPVKGMLTGPITVLNWSYVRNDQPLEETCKQIALSIRDEVLDLEKIGIGIIQIDEPALREGLPLRRKDWDEYLQWAVACFKICTSGVKDETQIHTHMCYSEFNDIITAIAELDADVISIEAARSRMELLHAFSNFHYPNDIGPGVYDIHSPRIPTQDEILLLLKEVLKILPADQIWVNPDCGLKTRKWEEVEPALIAIVSATRRLRQELSNG